MRLKWPEVHPGGESSRGVVLGEELQLVRIDTPRGVVTKEDEEPVTGNDQRNLALKADMTIDKVSEALDLKLDVKSEGEIVCQDSLRVPTVGPTQLGVSLDVTENLVKTLRLELTALARHRRHQMLWGQVRPWPWRRPCRGQNLLQEVAGQNEVEEDMEQAWRC